MSVAANQGGGSNQGGSAKPSFWPELFRVGVYKPSQGRIVRQVTFFSLCLLFVLVARELYYTGWFNFLSSGPSAETGVAGPQVMKILFAIFVGGIGCWVSYRLVNYSVFADFLVSVEAEMNKVSWPTREQLYRASVVVIFVIFAMALALFLFDVVWTILFEVVGIRYSGEDSMYRRVLKFLGW